MGNRVGYIFHNGKGLFSPILYVHNGGYGCFDRLKSFMVNYWNKNQGMTNDGLIFSPDAMMFDFVQNIALSPHSSRLKNLNECDVSSLAETLEYKNCFDEGCAVINASHDKFGEVKWSGGTHNGEYNILYTYFDEDGKHSI